MNLKKWKEDNITEKLFKNTYDLHEKGILKWQDQDVLNYTFNNKVKFILPRFNLQCNAFYDGNYTKYSANEMEYSKTLAYKYYDI